VQGQEAGAQIAQAIRVAGLRAETDVLIIARGGGSLEDLWAFNEEVVARAIYDCPIPCVSGVGHEIDFTIADFVADQRAPTPSAAAELVTPDREALWQQLERLLTRLKLSQQVRHARQHERQQALLHRLLRCHPQQRLQRHAQRLQELNRRLHQRMNQQLDWQRQQLQHRLNRLTASAPRQRLQQAELRLQQVRQRLDAALKMRLDDKQRRLALGVRGLNAFNPLATLERGYAIARRDDGAILRRADEVRPGETIQVRLAQGELRCAVTQIMPGD
jgi:exodeoxyribonuclease VII large subunit